MEEKNKGLTKKNIYLILLATAIVVIALAVIIALATNSSTQQLERPKDKSTQSTVKSDGQSTTNSKVDTSDEPNTSSGENPGTSEPNRPTTTPIVFSNPVNGGYVLTEYTSASVVYNKTLGMYRGHMGLDIAGPEGAEVCAVYDGEISSITTSYLQGTTITIDHGDSLSTVYNSIEAIDGLEVGQKVAKGDKLGVISTNNRQEYKDGAHLHFEVLEKATKVDPYKYLDIDGK